MPVERALRAGLLMVSLVGCARSSAPTSTTPADGTAPAATEPAPATGFVYDPATGGIFRYDAATGKCTNASGAEGYNRANPAVLFAAFDEANNKYVGVDAECVDFTDFDFGDHIGVSYRMLESWNFRGAKLTRAKFVFANMTKADFAGTDLRDLGFGYATIDGKGDKFTQGTTCAPAEHYDISCMR